MAMESARAGWDFTAEENVQLNSAIENVLADQKRQMKIEFHDSTVRMKVEDFLSTIYFMINKEAGYDSDKKCSIEDATSSYVYRILNGYFRKGGVEDLVFRIFNEEGMKDSIIEGLLCQGSTFRGPPQDLSYTHFYKKVFRKSDRAKIFDPEIALCHFKENFNLPSEPKQIIDATQKNNKTAKSKTKKM